jgi:hypothetical protein
VCREECFGDSCDDEWLLILARPKFFLLTKMDEQEGSKLLLGIGLAGHSQKAAVGNRNAGWFWAAFYAR